MQRGYICNFCCKKSHNLITEARLSGYPNNEREEIVTIFPVLFSQIWMKKIHIVEPWRMWSFCKTPSSLPPFIKPCPSLSYPPPRLISSRLLPRFQAKQKHMLRRHHKWRWGRDPPPARAPAGRRPVPSAAWSGSQNLPKGRGRKEIQKGL